MRKIKGSALALFLALALFPALGHAADKQMVVTGTVDCGQDTCSVMPPKGSSQPLLSFLVKSKSGDKILKQANLCSSGPLQMTVLVDAHENITKVLKVTCAK